MTGKDDQRILDHWRCFLGCGLMILSPFQYGIDFGLIGGLQAMPGFLKVCYAHTYMERETLKKPLSSRVH